MFDSLSELARRLAATKYIIDPVMLKVVFVASKMQKPIIIEGPPAVARRNWPLPSPQQAIP